MSHCFILNDVALKSSSLYHRGISEEGALEFHQPSLSVKVNKNYYCSISSFGPFFANTMLPAAPFLSAG
ncbi:MAG: hypothetical protein H7320_04310 [Ferruginibacter sp.]|nr:hypothetical protein [Ferruginibacter sp.]